MFPVHKQGRIQDFCGTGNPNISVVGKNGEGKKTPTKTTNLGVG